MVVEKVIYDVAACWLILLEICILKDGRTHIVRESFERAEMNTAGEGEWLKISIGEERAEKAERIRFITPELRGPRVGLTMSTGLY